MEFLKQYEVLYKKAKTDLKVAKNILEDFENGDDELDLEVVMFHLQQSTEKLLKSLLALNSLHFTKTHDIEQLINCTKSNSIKIPDNIEKLINLSDYAVEGRYAIIHDDIEDTHQYIDILDTFKTFMKKELESHNDGRNG